MKLPILPLALLLLTGSRLVLGQGPSPAPLTSPHSLSLDVQPTSAGSHVQDHANTRSNGAYGRRFTASKTRVTQAGEALQINVRNFGALPDNARVEWYFLATPVHPVPGKPEAQQEYIFDRGSQDLALGGGGTQTINAESSEVASSVRTTDRGRTRRAGVSFPRAGGRHEGGATLSGWIVRVVENGHVVAAKGSRQAYEDLARDDASFSQLAGNHAPGNGKKPAKAHRPKAG